MFIDEGPNLAVEGIRTNLCPCFGWQSSIFVDIDEDNIGVESLPPLIDREP